MNKKTSRRRIRRMLLKEINNIVDRENYKREKYVNFCSFVLENNRPLLENKKYLSNQELNENIFDTIMGYGGKLLGNLLPGFIGDLKQRIATVLMSALGLNARSKFGRFVVNVLEEIEYTKIMEYFSDWKTGCPKLIEYLLKAFSDFIQETILVDVFGAKNPDEATGIVGTARETFQTTVNNDLIPMIKPILSKFICNMDVSGMMSKIKDVATGKVSPKDLFKGSLSGAGKEITDAIKSQGEGDKKVSKAADIAGQLGLTWGINGKSKFKWKWFKKNSQ